MGSLNIIAAVSVIDVNPSSPTYLQETRYEKRFVDVNVDPQVTQIQMDAGDFKFNFERKESSRKPSIIQVDAKDSIDFRFNGEFNGEHESIFWATPLTEDKLTTFVTWKRAGISLQKCEYQFAGKDYSPGSNKCVLTTDVYRGHHNYGMSFYFGLPQGITSDGRSYGIVMQEGIGAKYPERDRASEDHINIAGEVFKLDQTLINVKPAEKADQIVATLNTIDSEQGTKAFAERSCNVTFKSDSLYTEGINLGLVAQRRYMWVGTYDIDCKIDDGGNINETGVRGMFEHVWSRY